MVLCLFASTAFAQTTSFTYQGRLTDGGTPANGNYDLQFALFNSLSGGTQVGSTQTINTVAVSNGVFTVSLDFGANSFPGANRFLEISARPTGGSFTLLTPRQQITSTPYAVRALNAASADSVPASGVSAGSGNYIQNSASPQASSNFNISGNGTAAGTLAGNVVNATTQYDLNGSRILSNQGTANLFAGAEAGAANTTGNSNSFFGFNAGAANAGGARNTFFGRSAGAANTIGNGNAFFAESAGFSNTMGFFNAFFGNGAGLRNTVGADNAFFGAFAGQVNTFGNGNAFFGENAGSSNTQGEFNTAIGFQADVIPGTSFNPTNATAIGARAQVTASNALVLGSITGINGGTNTNVGIGTTSPLTRFHIVLGPSDNNPPRLQSAGTNTFAAGWDFYHGTTGKGFVGVPDPSVGFGAGELILFGGQGTKTSLWAGRNRGLTVDTDGNVGIGTTATAPLRALQIGSAFDAAFTFEQGNSPNAGLIRFGDNTGWKLHFGRSRESSGGGLNSGTAGVLMTIQDNGNVGIGLAFPQDRLHVLGDIRVGTSGTNGCLKNNNGGTITGTCSSDLRFKRDLVPFGQVLNKLTRLQPKYYFWRAAEFPQKQFGAAREAGLVAQEVEQVLPELVSEDAQGYKQVDYSKLPLLLLQAIKEQQAQLATLRAQNAALNARLRAVERASVGSARRRR